MAAGIDRPTLGTGLGPSVPVVSPGRGERERREQPPWRRGGRNDGTAVPTPTDAVPERGEDASDDEPHQVDIVV